MHCGGRLRRKARELGFCIISDSAIHKPCCRFFGCYLPAVFSLLSRSWDWLSAGWITLAFGAAPCVGAWRADRTRRSSGMAAIPHTRRDPARGRDRPAARSARSADANRASALTRHGRRVAGQVAQFRLARTSRAPCPADLGSVLPLDIGETSSTELPISQTPEQPPVIRLRRQPQRESETTNSGNPALASALRAPRQAAAQTAGSSRSQHLVQAGHQPARERS